VRTIKSVMESLRTSTIRFCCPTCALDLGLMLLDAPGTSLKTEPKTADAVRSSTPGVLLEHADASDSVMCVTETKVKLDELFSSSVYQRRLAAWSHITGRILLSVKLVETLVMACPPLLHKQDRKRWASAIISSLSSPF